MHCKRLRFGAVRSRVAELIICTRKVEADYNDLGDDWVVDQ